MGAEHLGGCPDDVLAVPAAPEKSTVPEVLDEPGKGRGGSPEQRGSPVEVDRVAADDKRLEDLEMPPIQPVQGPLDAGTRACASRQRGQVVGSRASQVRSTADQFPELVVASEADVVGEAPQG